MVVLQPWSWRTTRSAGLQCLGIERGPPMGAPPLIPLLSACACVCPAADDHQALIWDIQQMPRAIEDPILAYTAEGEINNVQWASTQPDWIAICYNNCLEILRV